MREITVQRINPTVSGLENVVFKGAKVESRVQDDGTLCILNYNTGTRKGHIIFAAGQWISVSSYEIL